MKPLNARSIVLGSTALCCILAFQNCGKQKFGTASSNASSASTAVVENASTPTTPAPSTNPVESTPAVIPPVETPPAESCQTGQLTACKTAVGIPGFQTCSNGKVGACVAVLSACGGTKPWGSVIGNRASDDGSGGLFGLQCGQSIGAAKQCHSCQAQWIYPSGNPVAGGQVECRCL